MGVYQAKKIGAYPLAEQDVPASGTVTSVSVNTANGFAGTVSNPTTTPAISIQTSVTGILKGNGVAVSAASPTDFIQTNVLSLDGSDLTSIVNGVASTPIDISGAVAPTTNTLVNNSDNTMTSTVDGVDSTDDIITTNAISKFTNSFSTQVNGLDSGPEIIIDTNALSLVANILKSTVNSVDSNTVDLSTTILNKTLTGLAADEDRVVNTDTILTAFGKLSHAPTMTALRLSSNGVAIIIGTAPNTVTLNATGSGGNNTVTFPGGNVTSTPIIGNNSPTAGTAVSNITTGGVQQSITVIDQVLTGFSAAAGTVSATDSLLIMANKVVGNLSLKANLASPALTGTPTAPTQTQGDNSTKLATTAYVDTSLSTKEPTITTLSVAKGGTNIASYAVGDLLYASTSGVLSKLADVAIGSVLASGGVGVAPAYTTAPAFSGNPTAPSISAGDNSTKLANTAYTDSALLTLNNLNGLKLSWASSTTLGVSSGYWNVLGSSIMRTNAAVTINIANVGVVNGLDAGSAANNTTYAVYVIYHSTTPALNGGLLSANLTTPTLPSGYAGYRLIGYVRYATATFIRFYQVGNGTSRTIFYNDSATTTVVLSSGSSSAGATVSLTSFVPPGCRTGYLYYVFTATASSDVAVIRENGSPVTYNFGTQVIQVGTTGTVLSRGQALFISDASQVIQYAVSNASSNISFYVASYNIEL